MKYVLTYFNAAVKGMIAVKKQIKMQLINRKGAEVMLHCLLDVLLQFTVIKEHLSLCV